MSVSQSCLFPSGSPVYSYLRHSPGDGQTIDSQEAAVRAWCAERHLVLVRVFKDEARTGATTAGRDEFIAMIDNLRDSRLDPKPVGVVLWSFSRFARDYDDAEFYKADLRRRGYIIHSLTDHIPEGPFGRVIESITHWKDEERLREISKDSQRGLRWLAQQGYSTGGPAPRGYKKSAPIEIGHTRSGEPRLAYKLEVDPECEERVRKAWQMKLAGELNWTIHRATHLFVSINCYTTFFRNLSYAGYRKCGTLLVPDAHPAYISREDFDRIQARRQPIRAGQPRGSDLGHPRRRWRENPYLLSGVMCCGYCGGMMVGNRNGHAHFYGCYTQKQHGRDLCQQSAIVAHAIHKMVTDWLAQEVISFEHLRSARQALIEHLQSQLDQLKHQEKRLRAERIQVERKIQNLLNALEDGVWSDEVEARLTERRTEKLRIETELSDVRRAIKLQSIEIDDEALRYISKHLNEQRLHGNPEEARRVVQKIIKKAELFKNSLVLHYVPPLLDLDDEEKVGFRQWPVGNSNPCFCLERAAS